MMSAAAANVVVLLLLICSTFACNKEIENRIMAYTAMPAICVTMEIFGEDCVELLFVEGDVEGAEEYQKNLDKNIEESDYLFGYFKEMNHEELELFDRVVSFITCDSFFAGNCIYDALRTYQKLGFLEYGSGLFNCLKQAFTEFWDEYCGYPPFSTAQAKFNNYPQVRKFVKF